VREDVEVVSFRRFVAVECMPFAELRTAFESTKWSRNYPGYSSLL